jgi:hypothetical protein
MLAQQAQIEALTGQPIAQTIDPMPYFAEQQPFDVRRSLSFGVETKKTKRDKRLVFFVSV